MAAATCMSPLLAGLLPIAALMASWQAGCLSALFAARLASQACLFYAHPSSAPGNSLPFIVLLFGLASCHSSDPVHTLLQSACTLDTGFLANPSYNARTPLPRQRLGPLPGPGAQHAHTHTHTHLVPVHIVRLVSYPLSVLLPHPLCQAEARFVCALTSAHRSRLGHIGPCNPGLHILPGLPACSSPTSLMRHSLSFFESWLSDPNSHSSLPHLHHLFFTALVFDLCANVQFPALSRPLL